MSSSKRSWRSPNHQTQKLLFWEKAQPPLCSIQRIEVDLATLIRRRPLASRRETQATSQKHKNDISYWMKFHKHQFNQTNIALIPIPRKPIQPSPTFI